MLNYRCYQHFLWVIILGGWASYVVVKEVDAIEAIPKDMYVVIDFLCWQMLTK